MSGTKLPEKKPVKLKEVQVPGAPDPAADSSSSPDPESDSEPSISSPSDDSQIMRDRAARARDRESKKLTEVPVEQGGASSPSDESSSVTSSSSDSDEPPPKKTAPAKARGVNGTASEPPAKKPKIEPDTINGVAHEKGKKIFSRIPDDVKVGDRFKSNAYVPYDYANQAHKDLSIVKGKDFTKEKNKKKRGQGFRGGAIDINGSRAIKFED